MDRSSRTSCFFFGNYEGTRRTEGSSFSVTVPTNLVRSTCLTAGSANCDLSEYLTANLGGGAGQVYNPYEAARVQNGITQATSFR